VVGSDRNWAHSAEFDRGAMADFEERLGRARVANRAGYLRAKAATLLGVSDSRATLIAVELLHRVVDRHQDFLEVPWSHELLGNAYLQLSDLEAAEEHLRLATATADERRNGLSLPELTLAEVLLLQGRIEEAQDALDDVRELPSGMIWNSQLYRFAVASARCAVRSGEDAATWAQEALQLADIREPQLSRHPTVGLVEAEPRTLSEMRTIAGTDSPSPKWWRRTR
jgi:tetratricopeptide (TPR) repeat protein